MTPRGSLMILVSKITRDNVCKVRDLFNECERLGVLGGTRRRRGARSWRWKRRTPCSWRPCMSRCRCGEGRPPRPRCLRCPLSYCSSIWWVAGRSPQAVPAAAAPAAAVPAPSPSPTPGTTLTPTVSCRQQQPYNAFALGIIMYPTALRNKQLRNSHIYSLLQT